MTQPTYGSRFGQAEREWVPAAIDEACRNFLTVAYANAAPSELLLRNEWLEWCRSNPHHGYDLETADRVFFEVHGQRRITWERDAE